MKCINHRNGFIALKGKSENNMTSSFNIISNNLMFYNNMEKSNCQEILHCLEIRI